MERSAAEDPFLWDADTVAIELCSLARPCTRDLEGLSVKVRENDIDGHTLLTHELVGLSNAHDLRNELYDVLDVKQIKFKNALGEAIMKFRLRSPGFHQWKLNNLEPLEAGDQLTAVPEKESSCAARMTPQSETLQPSQPIESNDARSPSAPAGEAHLQSLSRHRGLSVPTLQPENTDSNHAKLGQPWSDSPRDNVASSRPVEGSPPPNPLKRRRLTAQLIQETPINPLPLNIPTEADNVRRLATQHPWDNGDTTVYLGDGSFRVDDLNSPLISMTKQLGGEGDAVNTPVPTKFSSGRRLVVNKIIKRLLIRNNRAFYSVGSGRDLDRAIANVSEADEIIKLDDIPDDLDKETLQEIEAEKKDQIKEHFMSKQRVRELLDDEVSTFAASWSERKLPKCQNKAYSLWKEAARHGAKKRVLEATAKVKALDLRIKKCMGEIEQLQWHRDKEVRFQAKSLVQSVEDKLYQSWLAGMLSSRAPPPKSSSKLKRPASKPQRKEDLSEDGEILTSSDEESFIVKYDSPDLPDVMDFMEHQDPFTTTNTQRTPRFVDSAMPLPADSIYIDLTQDKSSGPPSPVQATAKAFGGAQPLAPPISPARMKKEEEEEVEEEHKKVSRPVSLTQQLSQPLSWPDKYSDITKIVNFPASHWSRQKDRYALIICLLFKLGHSRRSAILNHVQQHTVDGAFQLSIMKHVSDPIKDLARLSRPDNETLAFDLSRLFLCFLKVKNLKESRLADLKPAQITKLKAQQGQNTWTIFHDFISKIAPLFPQDNQIYQESALDDLYGDEAADGGCQLPEEGAGPSRKAKEIVRDKEAVDLREREKLRAEEREARKKRLYAKLEVTTAMPSDKARLIINESKQDDQPLIYINEHIGNRIKDHQVGGVRFMWNQIIQDQTSRQGCLLSHSMGLGKTMQVITLLVAIQESSKSSDIGVRSQIPGDLQESKTLVICPAGLVNNWLDELIIWDKHSTLGEIHVIDSDLSPEERDSTARKWSRNGGILLMGYSLLTTISKSNENLESVFLNEPNIVIADEAHHFKNPESKVHQICSRFRTKSRIAMTGSPLANNIEEYFFMIDWVAPNFLGPLHEFRAIFANPIQRGINDDSAPWEKRKALTVLQFLKQTVQPKVHRATIKSCMADVLPPKREFVLFVRPKELQVKLYDQYVLAKDATSQGQFLGLIDDLRLLCNHPGGLVEKALISKDAPDKQSSLPSNCVREIAKAHGANPQDPSHAAKVELSIQILDHARNCGDKVLVFSQSILTLNYLARLFTEQRRAFSRLDGGTPVSKRQEQIKSFNTDEKEVFLISTKAGGVGLNIHGANRVIIFDIGWNPQHEQQAIGRAYRIGQTKPVTVYHLVTAGSFEQDLHGRTVFKAQLASRVVDKKNPISWGKRAAELKHTISQVRQEDLTKHLNRDQILDKLIAYSKDHKSITRIIPTDTFEEEDENEQLSPEEKMEVASMWRMQQLRMTNPKEYMRQKEMEDKRQQQQQALPSTHGPPSAMPDGIPVPLRTMDGASDVSRPRTLNADVASDARQSADASVASKQIPYSQPSPALMPIPGASTYFGKDAQNAAGERRVDGSKGIRTAVAQPEHQSKCNPFNSVVIKNPAKDVFGKKMREKIELMSQGTMSQEPLAQYVAPWKERVDSIVASIDAHRTSLGRGFLYDQKHWQSLGDFIQHDRFVLAVMFEKLPANYLAMNTEGTIADSVATFERMSASEFLSWVKHLKEGDGSPGALSMASPRMKP